MSHSVSLYLTYTFLICIDFLKVVMQANLIYYINLAIKKKSTLLKEIRQGFYVADCQTYSTDLILKYKKTFKARHHNIVRTCNILKSSTRKRYCTVVKHGIPPQDRRKMVTKDAQSTVLLLLLSSISVLSYGKYLFLL